MTKRPKNTPTAEPVFISVEVLVKGDMEKVWKCWNEPEHITQWYQASADWHAPRATNDLNVGGKFMTRMEAKDGSFGFDFEGTYTQVKLHEVISYILADRRTVDTLFKPQEDGIMITQTFMAETQNTPELQKFGWQSILNSFQSYVESLG
ncbi:MAG: SRPBCC domain-containing protein [Chitinophagaceae bacterium]|nr:SRPBCC domain-containing protein [Chitinophagaceae bacterium]